jgi:hypothetical protein
VMALVDIPQVTWPTAFLGVAMVIAVVIIVVAWLRAVTR